MEFDKSLRFAYNFSALDTSKTPSFQSPLPHVSRHLYNRNSESRYILSNSIDEDIFKLQTDTYSKKHTIQKSLLESPISNQLTIALKHIIPKKTLQRPKAHKKTILRTLSLSKNTLDNDINGFIQALFSHEPSPFRKVGLTFEPEVLDLRAADKILQEAKKIIKNGVSKKSSSRNNTNQIETFWKNQISNEKTIRWDIFEESLLVFFENFMVCNYGSLRKLNWKVLFNKLYLKLSQNLDGVSIWVRSPAASVPSGHSLKLVSYSSFFSIINTGELHRIMSSCMESLPYYIENLRGGNSFRYSCGCYYKGEWKDGRKEGSGMLDLCSGDIYNGTFNRSLREDYGILKGDGYLYKGNFKKDKFHGYGKINFPDKSFYEGVWSKNSFSNGVYEYSDGSLYKGEWKNFEYEGQGKLIMSDGTVKKGLWRNGKLCGDGKIFYPDGTVIKGFFLDDILQLDTN